MDPLPQRRSEIVKHAIHNTSISILSAAGTVSNAWAVIQQVCWRCRLMRARAARTSLAAPLAEAARMIPLGSAGVRWWLWTAQFANPRDQSVLQRRISPLSGRAHSLPGQPNQGIACLRLRYSAIEHGQHNAGLPRSTLPIVQRLSERRRQRPMDTEKDAGACFRLARRATHHDARCGDLDNAQLRRTNVVAIEAASRPPSPAGMQAVIWNAHLEAAMVKELDQPILDAEVDWKALVERGSGDPLRGGEERGGHGLVSCQMYRASFHGWAGPGVE